MAQGMGLEVMTMTHARALLPPEEWTDEELIALVTGRAVALEAPGLRRKGLADLRAAGLTELQARRLKAALELGRRALLPEPLLGFVVRDPYSVAQMLRAELDAEQETLLVLGMDAKHRIRTRHVAAIGQADRVTVSTSDVFRLLVREGLPTALVVHNHPSGEPTPSPQDEQLTVNLQHAGRLLGIVLLDHIVVARGGHYSFAERGLLNTTRTPSGLAAEYVVPWGGR